MRIGALDVGDRRIGIAVSDELGLTAQGLSVLRRTNLEADLRALQECFQPYTPTSIVVGLPRNMNGTEGPQAEKVRRFAAALEPALGIPLVFWDERLSTVAAERVLIEGNVRRSKRKLVIDKVAAVVILQGYLDSLGNTVTPAHPK